MVHLYFLQQSSKGTSSCHLVTELLSDGFVAHSSLTSFDSSLVLPMVAEMKVGMEDTDSEHSITVFHSCK